MKYVCLDCKYEFTLNYINHTHNMSFITLRGCPVCAKNASQKKVCPMCKSTNLKETINN